MVGKGRGLCRIGFRPLPVVPVQGGTGFFRLVNIASISFSVLYMLDIFGLSCEKSNYIQYCISVH
jgi:hypothetical protein